MWSELSSKTLVGLSLWLALAIPTAIGQITIFPVATGGGDETFPAISGDTVVWQFYDRWYEDWDIRGADIAEAAVVRDFLVSDLPGADAYPIIDGNDVVWQHEYKPGYDWDIYAADISDRSDIFRYAVSNSVNDERLPSVSNHTVVWQHQFAGEPDWDILGAKIDQHAAFTPFLVAARVGIDELFPCISGDVVVWNMQDSNAQPLACGADISDPCNPRDFYTMMELGEQEFPYIADGWLIGRETDDVGKVMMDNLYDPFNPESISHSGLTACPKIHGHIAVWQDHSNGTWDIRAYNRITKQEIVITDREMSQQVNPAVYVDTERARATIVWQDNRDGNWDIYAAVFDTPEIAGDN